MAARQKLNEICFAASFLLAAAIGGLTQSWIVFLFTLIILIAFSVWNQDIRPKGHR